MTRGFLSTLAGVLLLAVLLVATVISIWQGDRMERRQLKLDQRLAQVETQLEEGVAMAGAAVGRAPRGGIFGVPEPDYITRAFQDPDNSLSRDPSPWLPADTQKGGTLLLMLGSDPKGLNYVAENGADVSKIEAFNQLGMLSRHRKDPTRFGPELAYHLKIEDDFKTFTYKLREDVYWHTPAIDFSSGQFDWLRGEHKVTAQDVKFQLDMILNKDVEGAAASRSYLSELDSYDALDDYTFRIKFKKKLYTNLSSIVPGIGPTPEFLYAHDEDGNRYSEDIIGARFQNHWYNPMALGCGPYRFVSYEQGVAITLERDPRHPMGGNAFDKVVYQILKDQTSWPRKLRTGELHLSSLQPAQYRAEVLEGSADSPFKDGSLLPGEYWAFGFYYIGWNADRPYFNDKRVRWAMSHAFNAQGILDDIFMGLGKRSTGPISTFLPYYNQDLAPIPFDLDKAAALLDEAGWVDSNDNGLRDKTIDGNLIEFDFTLIVYAGGDEYLTMGNIFKEDLAQIGVKMNVQPLEWAVHLKRKDERDYDAMTLAWATGNEVDFHQIWHSSQADVPKGSNYVGFRNPEADKIIEAMRAEFEFDERVRLARTFHKIVYDEQPYTFFYTKKRVIYWQDELSNVWFARTRPQENHRPWYLASQ
jgi:peptide/nickel transport system substrate-binding protein